MVKPIGLPKNVIWFETKRKPRHRARRRRSPQQIIPLRLADLDRLFASRYRGPQLPDDDAGREDIEPVIHHLAALTQPARRAGHWLAHWAPWLSLAESAELIARCIAQARAWTADELAWRYRVTRDERDRLGLTTIGAIDFGKAARTKRRNQRNRKAKTEARRKAGLKRRADYEAQSIERAKPWIEEGISRRTWFRRMAQVRARGTGPGTP